MSERLSTVYAAYHGATAWSPIGQHTDLPDIPLIERGERTVWLLGERLKRVAFTRAS